jgi:methylmalonyl-CoA/ethylmalonyl-CoA epimerase
MHDTPIRVDHVRIAVESVEAAEPVLQALGCENSSTTPSRAAFAGCTTRSAGRRGSN